MQMRAVQFTPEAVSVAVESPVGGMPRAVPMADVPTKDEARRHEVRRRVSLAVDQIRAFATRG